MVLLVVIDHEEAQEKESFQNAGGDAERHWNWRQCANESGREQKTGRDDAPPALAGGIVGKNFCGGYELGTSSHQELERHSLLS